MIAAVECPFCIPSNTAEVEFLTVGGIVEAVWYTCVKCGESWMEPAGNKAVEE
jgi:hypothetical protein